MDFDIAVVGLGAMGSAAARALAREGARVVAFDQFTPPHTLGSSHGHSRIIREAYYEHPLYVPLVRRAYALWEELEKESGEPLLRITGGLMAGPAHGPLVRGAGESARAHGIPHEMLDARGIATRFPAFRPRPDWVGLLEHRAGMLSPERCIVTMQGSAAAAGAELRQGERVVSWREHGAKVRVAATSGTYDVGRVIVAAGPWLPGLEASVGRRLPLEIERQLSHWFEPSVPRERFAPSSTPIALWETTDAGEIFATFPDDGHGIKCGMHHAGSFTSPDTVDRAVSAAEDESARRLLEQVMPGAGGRRIESRVCLYTNTPDRHFLVDWSDAGRRVLLVSPCSGHGFKFAIAIGELVAQLALEDRSWIDLSPFSLARFA